MINFVHEVLRNYPKLDYSCSSYQHQS